jgi:hypothetical protein
MWENFYTSCFSKMISLTFLLKYSLFFKQSRFSSFKPPFLFGASQWNAARSHFLPCTTTIVKTRRKAQSGGQWMRICGHPQTRRWYEQLRASFKFWRVFKKLFLHLLNLFYRVHLLCAVFSSFQFLIIKFYRVDKFHSLQTLSLST